MVYYEVYVTRMSINDIIGSDNKPLDTAFVKMDQVPNRAVMMERIREIFNIEESDIDYLEYRRKQVDALELNEVIGDIYLKVLSRVRKYCATVTVVLKPGIEYSKPKMDADATGAQTDGSASEANTELDYDEPLEMIDPEDPALNYNLLACPRVEMWNGERLAEEEADTW